MSTSKRPSETTKPWGLLLAGILKSVRTRPLAWLMGVWLIGWGLFVWHVVHPASWTAAWGAVNNTLARGRSVQPYGGSHASVAWLHEVARWGEFALYVSTAMLALYAGYAIWVWWRYMHVWMPEVREERLRGGQVLEVLIPRGSKADARAAADMFGQLWNLLSDMSGGASSRGKPWGRRKMEAERLALSLEMWSTPHTGGKIGFYIWCPTPDGEQHQGTRRTRRAPGKENSHFIGEVRHLVKVHHPRCRVRWVEDPLEKALADLRKVPESAESLEMLSLPTTRMSWYELGLRADGRYPIGFGSTEERPLSSSSRFGNRAGSPGAGSDPLAAVLGMIGSNQEVPVMGIQVVIAARVETARRNQQALNKELARLREIEAQGGKKASDPEHEARVLALEEKAKRQDFDVTLRLVVAERYERMSLSLSGNMEDSKAEARLAALLRKYRQYDRSSGGVNQGFQLVRREQADISAHSEFLRMTSPPVLGQDAPVLGRWPREGVCLPRLLPFMRTGKPCFLNMVELSALYHFPHQGLEGVSALRWGTYRQIPPPAEAHVTVEQVAEGRKVMLGTLDDDLPPVVTVSPAPAKAFATTEESRLGAPAIQSALGEGANVLPPGTRGVGTRFEDLRRGTYVVGPMGSGKSVLLYNMVAQHMAAGRGVGILDGKGDSYEEVLRLVPPHLEGEVLTFDPENRSKSSGNAGGGSAGSAGSGGSAGSTGSGGRSIGINPLDGRVTAQLGVERVEALTMSLMKKMMGANWEQAVLMQRFLRDGISAVLQVEPMPTMLNLWRWLQDDGKGGNEYRVALVGKIRNRLVQDFWERQVPAMSSQQRSSMQNVLTRVDRYVKNDVRYLLLQPYSTVNFQEIMDRGTIFVGRVSPRLGEDQSFLGALVLNGFLTGAFGRQSIPQEQRRDYLLVVDEFQNFVDTARTDVERMLSMARGYRLGLMLAHQYTDQLPKEVLSAILKNVQTWVAFGLQADDARIFAGYMDGLEAEDFQNLPPYYTYQRTIVENKPTGVYSAAPLPVPTPAANHGGRRGSNPESEQTETAVRAIMEWNREVLWAAHAPEHVLKLVHGEPEESDGARRARILRLAREVYWPAEEGNPAAVQVLSKLSAEDRDLYRRARQHVLDKEEREEILAHPRLIRDKVERIERLSALRWGTPCAEVEALIAATLRGGTDRPEAALTPAQQTAPFSLLPEFSDVELQQTEDAQDS